MRNYINLCSWSWLCSLEFTSHSHLPQVYLGVVPTATNSFHAFVALSKYHGNSRSPSEMHETSFWAWNILALFQCPYLSLNSFHISLACSQNNTLSLMFLCKEFRSHERILSLHHCQYGNKAEVAPRFSYEPPMKDNFCFAESAMAIERLQFSNSSPLNTLVPNFGLDYLNDAKTMDP